MVGTLGVKKESNIDMRYWGFLAAKLVAVGAILRVLWVLIRFTLWKPVILLGLPRDPFLHDLPYTAAMMAYSLLCVGLVWLVIWDQRYRCRTCLRHLRMPVASGSWPNMFLIGRPRMEYICVYGHGTLKVPEEQIAGSARPDWKPNDDIWRELESLEESRK